MKHSVGGDHRVGFDDSGAVDGNSGFVSSLQDKRGVGVALDSVDSQVYSCDGSEEGNLAQEVGEGVNALYDVSS